MTNVRVVAAVVDTKQLTLYKEDGKTILIPQGDPRLRKILDEITPTISQGGVASVDMSEINIYKDFEEKSGGVARFFRVARNKVASFFGAGEHERDENVAPTTIGQLPALSLAIDDIMANAKPSANDDFGNLKTNETVVAVVGSGKNAKVIPGMENLKDQFHHACKLGSTKGVENFLRRLSAVIDDRQHSIHDLLRFMERGDLPIADDGSIVIYKVLNRSNDGNTFVDCHSRKVTQKVGSFVCMDPSLVDHNRRNECSTGLHVARRGYLSNFGGDVCVLAKVAPEDVIAVPNYDANKMRVCGYHILFELDQDSYNKLKNNRPMTDNPKAQALLGRAISGNHPARMEEVRITQARGGGVVITPLNSKGQPQERTKARMATALDDASTAPSVNPKQVAEKVTEAKAKPKATAPVLNTRQRLARDLYDAGDAQALIAFKKKSKVSWATLGFDEEDQKFILEMAANPVPKPAPKPATKAKPTVKAPAKKAAPAPRKVTPKPAPTNPNIVKGPVETVPAVGRPTLASGGGTKARMFELEKIYSDKTADPRHRALAAVDLINLRAKQKKSWGRLGYPKLTDQILKDDAQRFQAQADEAARAAQPAPTTGGPSQQAARALFNNQNWTGLAAFKKLKKKSWSALGFTSKEEAEIKLHIGG